MCFLVELIYIRDLQDELEPDGKMPWRRAWQPTQVFLPGESHGQRSLVGYSPHGLKELDMTEQLSTQRDYLLVIHKF